MTIAPPRAFDWTDKSVLITGGTGSFGRAFTAFALQRLRPRRLIVFSRDELKQHEMRRDFPDGEGPPMRYFIGDVRDAERLRRAMRGVDVVLHAAAMKQVPACEYNPIEAVMTNVMGSRNVVEAALDAGVKRAVLVSTDKAVSPANLYGATKLVAEKLFVHANSYSGDGPTHFSCVRYGNVLGSRGSVVPLFLERSRDGGPLPLTDERMTRFWISLDQVVAFVARCVERMAGGEVFVPKMPSTTLLALAEALAPRCARTVVGIRPGEKLNETLLSEDEARHAVEFPDMYVVRPEHAPWADGRWAAAGGCPVPTGFSYSSDTNTRRLAPDELLALVFGAGGAPHRTNGANGANGAAHSANGAAHGTNGAAGDGAARGAAFGVGATVGEVA